MDFGFTEEQQEVQGLARRILEDKVTDELLRQVEARGDARFDRATWDALAEAGLLGIGLPEELGGGGYGLIEQYLVLEEVGRTVAPVPVLASIVMGAMPIAAFGTRRPAGPVGPPCRRWLPDPHRRPHRTAQPGPSPPDHHGPAGRHRVASRRNQDLRAGRLAR